MYPSRKPFGDNPYKAWRIQKIHPDDANDRNYRIYNYVTGDVLDSNVEGDVYQHGYGPDSNQHQWWTIECSSDFPGVVKIQNVYSKRYLAVGSAQGGGFEIKTKPEKDGFFSTWQLTLFNSRMFVFAKKIFAGAEILSLWTLYEHCRSAAV